MMALPAWKLSVDSQQPKLAPCTRSQSARNLSSLVAAAEGCVGACSLLRTHGVKRKGCACIGATSWPGRVCIMVLLVWKLSVDGQQPKLYSSMAQQASIPQRWRITSEKTTQAIPKVFSTRTVAGPDRARPGPYGTGESVQTLSPTTRDLTTAEDMLAIN